MDVPGSLITPQERRLVKSVAETVARRFSSPIMVNIGVGRGATLHCLRAGSPNGLLIGVDSMPHNLHPPYEDMLGDLTLILGDSSNPSTQDQIDPPVHLLLIDSCHYYGTALCDILGLSPKVAQGGFMILHDYAPAASVMSKDPGIVGVRDVVEGWQHESWTEYDRADSVIVFERVDD